MKVIVILKEREEVQDEITILLVGILSLRRTSSFLGYKHCLPIHLECKQHTIFIILRPATICVEIEKSVKNSPPSGAIKVSSTSKYIVYLTHYTPNSSSSRLFVVPSFQLVWLMVLGGNGKGLAFFFWLMRLTDDVVLNE